MEEYRLIRKVGKIAITLSEGDELISAQLVEDNDQLLLAASNGQCIRFTASDVRQTGRTSMGVRSIRLDGDDEKVVDMAVIKNETEQEVLTISACGYGKRTSLEEYRLQGRAGKGILAGKFNENTGKLVNLKLINPDDDIMIIADNGVIIRMNSSEISKISRNTKGVRIMTLKNDGKIVCAAVTEHEEQVETPENEEGAENVEAQGEEIVQSKGEAVETVEEVQSTEQSEE
jgi:DNA gyrase subunit A